MKKILILLAGSQGANAARLELDQELQQIQKALAHAINHQSFEILIRWAARIEDLRHALLHDKPQIVHFSGHGAGNQGFILETAAGQPQFVSTEALAGLFELCQGFVECVLLNACYSDVQALAIHRHIAYVIGMNYAILDRAAIQFSVGFYDALAAGRSYEDAYRIGCNAIELEGIQDSTGRSEALIPIIKARRWVAPEGKAALTDQLDEPKLVEPPRSILAPERTTVARGEEKTAQSISISGSTVSGQIAQAGGDIKQSQYLHPPSAEAQLTVAEVIEFIDQIKALLKHSDLQDDQKNSAAIHLESAKEAAKEAEPDKDYAAKCLQKATKLLKTSSGTIEAGKGLWSEIEPILTKLLPWLGITARFLGF